MPRHPQSNQTESARTKKPTQTHSTKLKLKLKLIDEILCTQSLDKQPPYTSSHRRHPLIVQLRTAFRKRTQLDHNNERVSTRPEPETHNKRRTN